MELLCRLFSGVLNLDNLGSSHEDDLDERTKIIGSICINNKNINRLLLMDGHGRLTTRIMSYLNNNLVEILKYKYVI